MGVAVEPCALVLPGPGWHAPGGAVVPVGRLVVAGGPRYSRPLCTVAVRPPASMFSSVSGRAAGF